MCRGGWAASADRTLSLKLPQDTRGYSLGTYGCRPGTKLPSLSKTKSTVTFLRCLHFLLCRASNHESNLRGGARSERSLMRAEGLMPPRFWRRALYSAGFLTRG